MKLTVYHRIDKEDNVPMHARSPLLLRFEYGGNGHAEWYRCFEDPSRFAIAFSFLTEESAQEILSKGEFRRE